MPKGGSQYICPSVILINPIFRTGKTIILKCFYKNVNTFSKKKKMPKYIIGYIEISSDESNMEDPQEENFDEDNSNEENPLEEN